MPSITPPSFSTFHIAHMSIDSQHITLHTAVYFHYSVWSLIWEQEWINEEDQFLFHSICHSYRLCEQVHINHGLRWSLQWECGDGELHVHTWPGKKTPGVCSQAESANVESEVNINFICPRPIHTTSMDIWIAIFYCAILCLWIYDLIACYLNRVPIKTYWLTL